ncbi:MAG: WD40 repeat domain-containing protein [Caulobacter sp.]|jgi:WD40 repeat protein|nr:WD40 repeat domain-containing protein [Caulobacter sp.]
MNFAFDAYVTAALFDSAGIPMFALGDGTVRLLSGEALQTAEAHEGAVLSACLYPGGAGMLTGGDDGRLVWTRLEGAQAVSSELASIKGRWIDAVAASAESGLYAFASGRDLHVRDASDPAFSRLFSHEKSVSDLAFDPKGRRIATATYGGAALWYARIERQAPQMLKWAGSHMLVQWSPDGRFLMSSMQENSLHGWRLSDSKDMRMGGYPAKVKSLAFLSGGLMLATSGAGGAVIWPFQGSNGPMGKEAAEIAFEEAALVTRVAATPAAAWVAGGLDDGRVWLCDLKDGGRQMLKAEKGAAISALALSSDGRRILWGDEDGGAGVIEVGG